MKLFVCSVDIAQTVPAVVNLFQIVDVDVDKRAVEGAPPIGGAQHHLSEPEPMILHNGALVCPLHGLVRICADKLLSMAELQLEIDPQATTVMTVVELHLEVDQRPEDGMLHLELLNVVLILFEPPLLDLSQRRISAR